MSTIRPLATIAILAVVGVFLADKINKGHVADKEALAAWGDASPVDGSSADPSSPSADAAPAMVSGLPPIGGGQPLETSVAGTSDAPLAGNPVAVDPSELPPLPPMPVGSASAPVAPADPLANLPLPENIPTANYDAPQDSTESAAYGRIYPEPVLPAAPPVADSAATPVAPPTFPLVTPPPVGAPTVATPPAMTSSLPPAPVTPSPVLPSTAPVTAPALAETVSPIAPPSVTAPPVTPEGGFAAAKPAIEAALASKSLPQALLLLSAWHGDPSLSMVERQEVDLLLSQLAGSVVYSNQHLLEGPYTVRPGETLETVAQRYNVPWQLLAKINGVASPSLVTPGQTLKVVRGPFRATIDVSDNELYLLVGGRYAGKFPVTFNGAAPSEGSWRIEQKQSTTGKQLVMTGGYGLQAVIADQASPAPGAISVATTDMGDLFDILSVGSEVTVRR